MGARPTRRRIEWETAPNEGDATFHYLPRELWNVARPMSMPAGCQGGTHLWKSASKTFATMLRLHCACPNVSQPCHHFRVFQIFVNALFRNIFDNEDAVLCRRLIDAILRFTTFASNKFSNTIEDVSYRNILQFCQQPTFSVAIN